MNDLPIFTASLEPAGTRDKGGFLKTGANGAPLRLIKIVGPQGVQTEHWINDDQQAADNTIKRLGYKRTGEWTDGQALLTKKSFTERNKIGIILGSVALALVLLVSVSSIIQARLITSSQSSNPPTTTETANRDAVAEMYQVFIGATSQDQIRTALNLAASATSMPQTNEGYLGMGSALSALRSEYGVAELDVLACIPDRAKVIKAKPGKDSFVQSSAWCAVSLTAPGRL